MATAAQVTKAILQEILVRSVEAPLEPDELQDTIFAMNNYMTALDADGVHLGYTVVSSLGDEVTVPAGALQGLIANVAIDVAPQFGATVSQALVLKAKKGMSAMRKLGITIGTMSYPDSLPVGSGNEGDWYNNHDHFYTGADSATLTETGNNVGLETNT